MRTRERPGWARPSTDPSHRIVSCPTCGDAMSWGRFIKYHDCGPAAGDTGPGRGPTQRISTRRTT